ncbi:MAG: SDR family NAD(P)-dependent oxidoreductase [Kiritimatiellae bacterium]|nr:SDR family NAD(P)-dependent oxidoreductase [Kiritimatiellia bacterium]
MTRSREAWARFLATRVVGVFVDAAVVALAYLAAVALRFDFAEPTSIGGWGAIARSYVTVCVVHLSSLLVFGCYRLAWRRIRGVELPRYVGATAFACAVLTAMRFLMPEVTLSHIRPPYSITIICFFLATIGVVGVRVLWRVYWTSRVKEDALLERNVKHFDDTVARRFLAGKTVMVTGAGGSIGSEIVRQVAAAGAKKVLMVERGENALYEINRRMNDARCVPLMYDVNDRGKMDALFAAEKPEVVLHAAAYKHVPMVEMNPEEGWRNNTEATRGLAELAKAHGVRRFVLVSTDKAVNPVSVMGRTKLAAEQAIMALNDAPAPPSPHSTTSFCAVRFGNVFGSSGSVVPLFKEQIAKRRPVTVTHPDMKRYFMTIEEAVSLVLQAASRDERAIYTLDMGEPVRILDLAEGMIEQAGYRPYVDIPVVFTGVRPGEKLFEEIDVSERSAYKTDMAKIYITKPDVRS